jgi:hypothetical protein
VDLNSHNAAVGHLSSQSDSGRSLHARTDRCIAKTDKPAWLRRSTHFPTQSDQSISSLAGTAVQRFAASLGTAGGAGGSPTSASHASVRFGCSRVWHSSVPHLLATEHSAA